jgi:hypothetical protein
MKAVKVVELFAGVGGFRLGLDQAANKNTFLIPSGITSGNLAKRINMLLIATKNTFHQPRCSWKA